MSRRALKAHWYLLHLGECPVCGRDQSFRERIYGKKPSDPEARVRHLPISACSDHFT